MKRFTACLAFGVYILVGTQTAFAQNNYFTGFLGAGTHPDASTSVSAVGFSGNFDFDVDTGLVVGGAIGVELDNQLRFEGEFTFHGSSTDDSQFFFPGESLDIDVFSIMANGFYDLDLNGPLKPYVGVGLGFGFIRAEADLGFGFVDEDTDFGFAYQLMTGVAFEISPQTAITLGYRYFGMTDPDVSVGGANFDSEFASHEFIAGARIRF